MSALYEHCTKVYGAMEEAAQSMNIDDEDCVVYEGFLTKLFGDLELSIPYYTAVLRELRRMDCIRQLRRGGGSSPSMWVMLQHPDEDLWAANTAKPVPLVRSSKASSDQMMQMMRDLSARVGALEEKLTG